MPWHMPWHHLGLSDLKHVAECLVVLADQRPLQDELALFVLLGVFLRKLVHPTYLRLKLGGV